MGGTRPESTREEGRGRSRLRSAAETGIAEGMEDTGAERANGQGGTEKTGGEWRRRVRRGVSRWGVIAAVSLTTTCGARTGLRRPCIVELERERPSVVFVTDRTVRQLLEINDGAGSRRQINLVQKELVDGLIETIADVARIGWVSNPPNSWHVPECGEAVPAEFAPTLGGGEELRRRLLRTTSDPPYMGTATLTPALLTAYDALGSVRNVSRRFVFLFYSGTACNARTESESTLAAITPMRARTMVVMLEGNDSPRVDGPAYLATDIAVAGGLATRTTHPASYRVNELSRMRDVLVRELITPYYCDLQVPSGEVDAGEWLLLTATGRTIPMGELVDGGWVFDGDRQRVKVTGDLCMEMIASRSLVRLISAGNRCD